MFKLMLLESVFSDKIEGLNNTLAEKFYMISQLFVCGKPRESPCSSVV